MLHKKKRTNYGTFPELPRHPPPTYFGPPGSTSQINIFLNIFLPTVLRGGTVGPSHLQLGALELQFRCLLGGVGWGGVGWRGEGFFLRYCRPWVMRWVCTLVLYHPTHSEGSRVEFIRYEKWSTTMDVR